MRTKLWLASKFLISVLVLVGGAIPASATACDTAIPNSCTGSVSSGSNTALQTTFNGNNPDLTFNNITFDSATGTYTTAEGLDSNTAMSAALFGLSFIGCISNQSPCASNTSLTVGTIVNWNGSTDPALTGPPATGQAGQFGTITILLPASVFAFGVDILNANNWSNQAPFLIDVPGTSTASTVTSVNLPGSVFYGYRSATAITKVTIYAQITGQQLGIDNFELGTITQTSETSEVGTMLLVASGLFALRFARRFTV